MTYTLTLSDPPALAVLTPPPRTLPVRDRARFALHYAVLAPSVHNTQPWRFRVRDSAAGAAEEPLTTIDLLADLGRDLPVLDDDHRQLVISCGAALAALRCGLASLGLAATVTVLPDPAQPRWLATVQVRDGGDGGLGDLAAGLRQRRSYRGGMTGQEPTAAQQVDLDAEAAGEGCPPGLGPRAAGPPDPRAPGRARRARRGGTPDGRGGAAAVVEPRPTRPRRRPTRQLAAHQRRVGDGGCGAARLRARPRAARTGAESDDPPQDAPPALAVLRTAADATADWLAAGQALMRVLLRAEACGLQVGYVNQPTEVPAIRRQLAERSASDRHGTQAPQLVLRIGHAAQPLPPATPRRTVAEVLLP